MTQARTRASAASSERSRRRAVGWSTSESELDAIWAIPHTHRIATFDDFIAELETEARAEGPEAIAELEAFRLHFSLARQLAEQRRARHLTQKQLAEMTGIDQAEISRIERGQANPTTATLGTLTRALGVDVRLVPAA
jgi:DNA-binding XRE family transcriptional regulator